MSFGRGAPRGRGGGGFGGRGGGGFGGRGGFQNRDMGPPATILGMFSHLAAVLSRESILIGNFGIEMGKFMHACEGEMICESINPKVPHFNAQIFLENKTAVGKVDEVLGPINQVYFTIKPSEGIQATSFKEGDKFYIGSEKLLPLEKFLPKPKPPPGAPKVKRAGRGGPARGGRGGPRGGFGGRGGAPRGRGGSGFGGRGGGRGGGGFGGGRGAPRGGGGFGGGRGRGGFSRGGR
ncbi:H/ACA ribonucleoprotein complex subunit 1 [Colletotrichum simmondsii]|uniref:H/ACA ribonucleoprotein complex subunit n=2 Tax=Colletotrichum acutatum species complex TaxID=2707335 RepID=A0A135TYJ5_9PEZI|nr:H/ACA ribonucleoprotein complex subunit 1 [Colletotrichum nymphaeae SA-01]KXH53228.1 H/ACA ribonucleoprotein complex subunit 1 [Colletotrichum simmondsii]